MREGEYVAEVDVEIFYEEEGWSPYLSLEDGRKLDEVRTALRPGDINAASMKARVFTLTPVMKLKTIAIRIGIKALFL